MLCRCDSRTRVRFPPPPPTAQPSRFQSRRRLDSPGPRPARVVARLWAGENRRVKPELPTGTVTFLFTDIEGSTRLLGELGDRYADVLAEHRRALREAWGR